MSKNALKSNFSPLNSEGSPSRIPNSPIVTPSINSNDNNDRTANDRVKVILRVRPPTANDERKRTSPLEFDPAKPNKLVLHRPDAPVTHTEFEFDRVLPPGATQQDVYLSGVKDVVDDVLKGYNGTVSKTCTPQGLAIPDVRAPSPAVLKTHMQTPQVKLRPQQTHPSSRSTSWPCAGKTYTLGNIQPQAIGMIPRCAAGERWLLWDAEVG
eukprot:1117776-Pelagomonas_calceolata.AAC.8